MAGNLKKIFGKKTLNSRIDYINLSRKGIPMEVYRRIQNYTKLSTKEMAMILPVSERQLIRYENDHVLRKDISSHLIQLLELFEKGNNLFGEEKFQIWLRSEIMALGKNKPIEILDTPIGIEMVGDIIGRIEHGVYS